MKKWMMLSIISLLMILASCGNDEGGESEGSGETEDKGEISIGMNNWAENVAVSNMWKIILEEQGYEVTLENVDKAILYEGLESGDIDIGMEIWLPNTDGKFYEEYQDVIDWREEWYEGTDLALTVPSYVEDVNSIEDLQGNADQFEGEIVGIDPGASIMELTEEVMSTYELDNYELLSSSEPTMLTELQTKMDNEEPVVVTLWKPHWVFAEMDLKLLEDPENVYGDSENISYAARLGLEDEHPEVVEWFDNFMLNDDQLGSLMAELNEADEEAEGAQNWIDDNQDVIDEWLTTDE
ncbi:glycine betaine ABC transporter substrate-binding protein [Alkalibacillus salilacus]|uniref:Glycine betaine/proline transport system substrate-binding protein n=1 Tax=Alkalibacillus salilacus TaxID=284582 RepID=A0ABT9VEI5_9BACI|nr:glycine betaine ABC transporter substrate-binding protein [Alkalibacillus salilacus]MDQ0159382.1 glycine betaine/proline transport system substrate-binding protein [Alkalibacillus salilacus]